MRSRKPGQGRVFCSWWARLRLCGRIILAWLLLFMPFCLVAGLWVCAAAADAAAPEKQQTVRSGKKKSLHGQMWAFGRSEERKAALWRHGIPPQSLKQRAVSGGSSARGKGAVDTEGGIKNALSAVQADKPSAPVRGTTPKSSLRVRMKNETTTWNVTPMRESLRPDEALARDSRHVVRAFADMEPTDDLSISVGPELLLKDEQHGAESAGSSQPYSALGLGMQFKLDF